MSSKSSEIFHPILPQSRKTERGRKKNEKWLYDSWSMEKLLATTLLSFQSRCRILSIYTIIKYIYTYVFVSRHLPRETSRRDIGDNTQCPIQSSRCRTAIERGRWSPLLQEARSHHHFVSHLINSSVFDRTTKRTTFIVDSTQIRMNKKKVKRFHISILFIIYLCFFFIW